MCVENTKITFTNFTVKEMFVEALKVARRTLGFLENFRGSTV